MLMLCFHVCNINNVSYLKENKKNYFIVQHEILKCCVVGEPSPVELNGGSNKSQNKD